MADHQGPEPRGPGRSRPLGAGEGTAALDLAASLEALDRATRNFAERLGAARDADRAAIGAHFAGSGGEAAVPAPATAAPIPGEAARDSFEARMREAEREASEYLEQAKRRADSLVNAMVAAVEREAAEMRREAEVDLRARRQAVEADAARLVEEAGRVADRIVAERQQRIASLSDGIAARAQALTAGMEDAQRVREQFETFVRALSQAADRIASAREPDTGRPDGAGRPSAIAA